MSVILSTKDMDKATVFDHVFINVWTASAATDELSVCLSKYFHHVWTMYLSMYGLISIPLDVWTAATATDEPTKAPGSLANSRTFASRSERSNHLSIDGSPGEGHYPSSSKVGIIDKQSKPGGTQDFSFLL